MELIEVMAKTMDQDSKWAQHPTTTLLIICFQIMEVMGIATGSAEGFEMGAAPHYHFVTCYQMMELIEVIRNGHWLS